MDTGGELVSEAGHPFSSPDKSLAAVMVSDGGATASAALPPTEVKANENSAPPVLKEAKPSEQLAPMLARVEEAALAWDVRSDLPEGRFVSALIATVGGLGRVMDGSRQELVRLFDQQREAAKEDLERTKELTKAANIALSQARNAKLTYVIEQEAVVSRMIEQTLPMFAKQLQGALIVREKRLDRDVQRRRYAVAGLVTLGLMFGGYGLRTWQDSEATRLAPYCLTHLYQSGGHTYCDVSRLISDKP